MPTSASSIDFSCSRELLLQAAQATARRLLGADTRGPATPRSVPRALDLYSGPSGIALFWAALAAVVPERHELARERALRLLEPVRRELPRWSRGEPDDSEPPLGILGGLGAPIYALSVTGGLLGEPDLVSEALEVAGLLTRDRIARDERLDLFSGTAGMLLALRALDRSLAASGSDEGRPVLAERIRWSCEHLLARRSPSPSDRLTWPIRGRFPSGFSHGASGIAYSLAQAYDANGDRLPDPHGDPALPAAALEAAVEGCEFERGLLRARYGNWLPFEGAREDVDPLVAWCHGAPGVALSRVALYQVLTAMDETSRDREGMDGIASDLKIALTTTMGRRQTLEDDLCCGNLGRAGVLFHAARTLRHTADSPESHAWRQELDEAADRLVYRVLARAKARGGFQWSKSGPDGFNPGLFQGAAGLGLMLLHLAEPTRIPMPLVFAPVETRDPTAQRETSR